MKPASQKLTVSQLTLYNPARLSDDEIIASFAARQAVFERVMADIAAEKPASRSQHHLIVGQRGMGKSTLLARIAAELRQKPELSAVFIPLVFAEEQYAVDRLSKFWLNCLDSLADACERAGNKAATDRIDYAVRQLTPRIGTAAANDTTPADEALGAFLAEAKELGRRPVLLVDNLQLVFERLSDKEQHVLRELLQRPGAPLLVGASPSPPPENQDYGAAFYDHFKVHYLPALSVDEMRQLMLTLAEKVNRQDVSDNLLKQPHRLDVLRQLTGGNPRTTVTLFFLYAEDFSPSVFGDLENLLDRVTPLYKARFEELSAQQQVVASAVANHWDPVTARALAEATGLPITGISPQLDRLEKIGFVERVRLFEESSTGFQIAERFFNVWFLMRSASRRQRREVEFLTRFIECFYEAKERLDLAHRLQSEFDFSPDRHVFAQALACTLDETEARDLKRHTDLDALQQTATEARQKLAEVIDFSTMPHASIAFAQLKEKLCALPPHNAEIAPTEFALKVLGSRHMFHTGDRERLALQNKLTASEVRKILSSIDASTAVDEKLYGKDTIKWLSLRLSSGQLALVDDPDEWNAAFLQMPERLNMRSLLDTIPANYGGCLSHKTASRIIQILQPNENDSARAWFNWGYDLHVCLKRYAEAETAYRISISKNKNYTNPWNNLANLLTDQNRYQEAEQAYRQAIALDKTFAYPWVGFGNLFKKMARFKEAESAYRQALKINKNLSIAWNNLGNLLTSHLGQFNEAETAYHKAIALDSSYAHPWNGLGNLLKEHLQRFDEASDAYHKAINVDPKYPHPWNGLGNLFKDHHKQFAEAENAYRKAIQLDDKYGQAWVNLARLLHYQFNRFQEAEEAYRHAIAIEANSDDCWNDLGNLLLEHLHKVDEAESAYRKAISINEKNPYVWNNLGNLLKDQSRFEEAETAYKKAISFDENYAYPWNGLGNLYCDHLHRYQDAVNAFERAHSLAPSSAFPSQNLVFLRRDFLGEGSKAKSSFLQLLDNSSFKSKPPDIEALQSALFAAYAENWGEARIALGQALASTESKFPVITFDDWFRASSVFLHLNYGDQLLAFLKDRGDDARLRPWYEALSALHNGDKGYLQNLAPEVRVTAEYYFDQIEMRLNALPEKTRRRPLPKPVKTVVGRKGR